MRRMEGTKTGTSQDYWRDMWVDPKFGIAMLKIRQRAEEEQPDGYHDRPDQGARAEEDDSEYGDDQRDETEDEEGDEDDDEDEDEYERREVKEAANGVAELEVQE